MGETLLTPAQVATQLGVKPPKVRELIRHRKLSAINIASAIHRNPFGSAPTDAAGMRKASGISRGAYRHSVSWQARRR